ncbi:hypothetical protein PABG_11775 [Paracoccidioides brasiliensis Pb03]|nr:hypothetical protein PABG_11775 [Paracoccidioides brasiliensis Pb03]
MVTSLTGVGMKAVGLNPDTPIERSVNPDFEEEFEFWMHRANGCPNYIIIGSLRKLENFQRVMF